MIIHNLIHSGRTIFPKMLQKREEKLGLDSSPTHLQWEWASEPHGNTLIFRGQEMRRHLHSPSFLKPVPDNCQKAKEARTMKLHGYFHSYPVILRIPMVKFSKCKAKSFARTTRSLPTKPIQAQSQNLQGRSE